jgi:hypothetical protein
MSTQRQAVGKPPIRWGSPPLRRGVPLAISRKHGGVSDHRGRLGLRLHHQKIAPNMLL